MKKLLPVALTLLSIHSYSQDALYGVTSDQAGTINWTKIRVVERDGKTANSVLLDATKPSYFLNARTQKKVTPLINGIGPDELPAPAGIAALAYDEKNDRLYFAPMFREGGIRYIDLNTGMQQKAVTLFDDAYNLVDRAKDGEGKNITRMTIGLKGYGYAISNDGNSFIRFATGTNPAIENLGTLVDDEANGANTVHSPCTAWGGDMVAAATGDLYLFTMRQQVFKINPDTRVATYVGTIKGPDNAFTVNGAAVTRDGQVVLSSSVKAGSKWVIEDMNTLEAKEVSDPNWLNASDLASPYLLFAKTAAKTSVAPKSVSTGKVGMYPNPVTQGVLTIVFNDLPAGKYYIDMLNAAGVDMQSKAVNVQQKGQTETFNTNRLAKGLYVVRITNASRQEAFVEKVMIQ
jgi:hypothetical protein